MDGGPQDWGTPLFERVLQRAGVGQGTSLLDLGCGSGLLCRIAADRGAQVTGIDLDAGQIEQAAARVPEGAFDVGDMLVLPYPAGRFDAVVCVQSITHVANPLSADGRLERLATLAGLAVAEVGEVVCPFRYPDEDTLLRGLLDSGLGRRALRAAGSATVRRAVLAGLAGYRTSRGGYRLDDTFRYLVGSTPDSSQPVIAQPRSAGDNAV